MLSGPWTRARLGDVCDLNPRRPELRRPDTEATSFVPMAAVAESGRGILRVEERPYAEVRRGYTFFAEGDILFAKITPCMQNGKHAIARGLRDGIGFASTEFHILRPRPEAVVAEWVHYFLLQPHVLLGAERSFSGAVGQQRVPPSYLADLRIPAPPIADQRRVAARLTEQLAAVERARISGVERVDACALVIEAILRGSLSGTRTPVPLSDCLDEVRAGVGARWADYPVVGATRSGLAPAKEAVGKYPERYKPVKAGTVFYNPMRILLGSIAMVDEGEPPGITSPDYVVVRPRNGILHHRWFYYWLRSASGAEFIKTLARGAVRERLLYRRLAVGSVLLPSWRTQEVAAASLWQLARLRTAAEQGLRTVEALPAAVLREVFDSIHEPREHHEPVLASGNA